MKHVTTLGLHRLLTTQTHKSTKLLLLIYFILSDIA
jgi:hypothetical protein